MIEYTAWLLLDITSTVFWLTFIWYLAVSNIIYSRHATCTRNRGFSCCTRYLLLSSRSLGIYNLQSAFYQNNVDVSSPPTGSIICSTIVIRSRSRVRAAMRDILEITARVSRIVETISCAVLTESSPATWRSRILLAVVERISTVVSGNGSRRIRFGKSMSVTIHWLELLISETALMMA